MSTNTQNDPIPVFENKSLQKIVNFAAGNLRLTAVKRHSFIINEVAPEFQIETNEIILSTLLSQLLCAVVSNTSDSCIRIEAKEYDDVIFVTIKNNNHIVNDSVALNLDAIKILARKMNGTISTSSADSKTNSIILSFPNFKVAA